MSVLFEDNSIRVKEALNEAIIAYLHEAAGEVEAQAKRNTRVDQSNLKNSWSHIVNEGKKEATIGSPLENAIWEEFGTGEYALKGDGRKGGWYIPEEKLSAKAKSKMQRREIKGKVYYFTRGKTPSRAFQKAYESSKPKIIKRAQQVIGGKMK